MNTENVYHHLLTNIDVIMTIGHTLYTTGVTFGAGTGYPSDAVAPTCPVQHSSALCVAQRGSFTANL
jgi:hypothetical protein